MALTVTQVKSTNTALGKMSIFDVTADSSYASGGETLDLSSANTTTFTAASANDYFTAVDAVIIAEGPYDSDGAPIARTTCCGVQYDFAASRAVATGKLYYFKEDGTSGVTAEASGDLSTVIVRILVIGR